MADHPLRSATDRRLGEPLPHQPANQTQAHPLPINLWPKKDVSSRYYEVLIIVSNGYPSAKGRLPTRYSPVRRFPQLLFDESPICWFSLDLHVLGTPPAFILSQDQTLNKMFITHIFRCLYSVTRMTHYASLLCFEFSRTNKFCLFVFSFKVFHFQGFSPFNSRPVLHYEVFKVPLCFSATASLLYIRPYVLSTQNLIFFALISKQIVTLLAR